MRVFKIKQRKIFELSLVDRARFLKGYTTSVKARDTENEVVIFLYVVVCLLPVRTRDVILTSIRRRPNFMDVAKTSKQGCVRTGL